MGLKLFGQFKLGGLIWQRGLNKCVTKGATLSRLLIVSVPKLQYCVYSLGLHASNNHKMVTIKHLPDEIPNNINQWSTKKFRVGLDRV